MDYNHGDGHSNTPHCDPDLAFIGGYFYELTILLPFFLFLMLLLLCHSIKNQYVHRDDVKFNKQKNARIRYFCLQFIAIYWFISDLFRLVLDPKYAIIRNNILCKITAFSSRICALVFYGIYLFSICIYLEESFKGSYLALNRWTMFILKGIIVLIPISPVCLLLADHPQSECLRLWIPDDIKSDVEYCDIPLSLIPVFHYGHVGIVIVICSINILLTVLFTNKLRKLLSHNAHREDLKFKFKALIIS